MQRPSIFLYLDTSNNALLDTASLCKASRSQEWHGKWSVRSFWSSSFLVTGGLLRTLNEIAMSFFLELDQKTVT